MNSHLCGLTTIESRPDSRREHGASEYFELFSIDNVLKNFELSLDELEDGGAEAEVNAGLVELIKESFAIRNQLLSGSHASIEAMSGRLGMNKGRLTSLVRLSYLGPEIVRALLAGSQSNALTPSRLLRLSKNLPHDWKEQRRFLGFAA